MANIIIETSRDGYAPSQIHRTLTVGELIGLLQDFDEDSNVYLSFDNGYTYGGITYDCIREQEEEEEDDA